MIDKIDDFELQCAVASEITRQWALQTNGVEHTTYPGLDGKSYGLIFTRKRNPRLVEEPADVDQLDAELALRSGHEALAFKIQKNRQILAQLRPIGPGDLLNVENKDLLRCADPEFAEKRQEALQDLVQGCRRRSFLVVDDTLVATLHLGPPHTLDPRLVLRKHEEDLVKALRASGLREENWEEALREWAYDSGSFEGHHVTSQILTIEESCLIYDFRHLDPVAQIRVKALLDQELALQKYNE